MAFKILTALLVVCVAHNAALAASLPVDKPEAQSNEVTDALNAYGITPFGNPLACVPHLYDLWNGVQELKGLFADFNQIRNRNKALKAECSKLTDESKLVECLNKADEATQVEMTAFMEKVKLFVPKAVAIGQKFKKCLFDG